MKTLTFIIARTYIRIIWPVPNTVINFSTDGFKAFLVESNFVNYKNMYVRVIT